MVTEVEDTDLKPEKKDVLSGETCVFCNGKTLTLTETIVEIPYFGVTHIFAMDCSNCNYHKTDIEVEDNKGPSKFTLDLGSEDDLKIRIVKSSNAKVKIPYIGEIEPGEASNGYITNVEGVLNRFKSMIEAMKEESEEKDDQKKAKNLLKKLNKILWGREKLKLIIEDPSGNSAIISEKAKKEKL